MMMDGSVDPIDLGGGVVGVGLLLRLLGEDAEDGGVDEVVCGTLKLGLDLVLEEL